MLNNMIFLSDIANFKKGRKKGSKNKIKKHDFDEHVAKLKAANKLSSSVRGFLSEGLSLVKLFK